ncbi:MAG: hypothetical protein KGL31_13685 [candidate division NC10 bacterium]|nr:hypothetical protein [candidate division NC10 bacterium]MDE2322942.1 hypothetical protein [candidate division NC10 bacterium]
MNLGMKPLLSIFVLAAMSGLASAQTSFDASTRILKVPTIDFDGTVYQNLQASLDADGRLEIRSFAAPSIPQDACIERQTLQTYANSPPRGYLAVLAWANAMTVSASHQPGTTASVEIDYIRILEEDVSTGQLTAVAGASEEYSQSRAPLSSGEGALWVRVPRCASGSSSRTISSSRVSGGVLGIDLASTPGDYAHWWTPRGDIAPFTSGKRYLVESRFRVNGGAALQFGLDYWRTKTIDYNGYDVTCVTSNNCEAWVSAWFGDTQGAFIVRQFPVW